MRRPLVSAIALALIGSAAAALLSSQAVLQQPAQAAPAHLHSPAPALPGRIVITPAQLRQAYAAGLIDRPIKTLLDVREPMTYGQFLWNDKNVPRGQTWIRIDLKSQLLSVFRSGHEIGTAVILYGTDGYPTPTGKFPVLAKLKNHRSRTYDNAPMPYTLRLRNDGVSIHGSNVRWGFASHGCIGIPTAFAAKLFDVVSKGDEVLIVSGKPRSRRA
jgi:lipoprotein-anchoring transpeptidase ErfK/SrfK